MNFSYPIASPPSSQPAECRMKLAPHRIAACIDTADSSIACPSSTFDVVNDPEHRSGRPTRRAICPTTSEPSRRLGRPERRRARAQRHRRQEVAVDDRRAGPHELAERDADHRLGVRLGDRAGERDRSHRATEDERHDDRRLVGRRVGADRSGHRAVPHERRVDVDVAEDDAVRFEEVGAERDAGHLDRVLGAAAAG